MTSVSSSVVMSYNNLQVLLFVVKPFKILQTGLRLTVKQNLHCYALYMSTSFGPTSKGMREKNCEQASVYNYGAICCLDT